MAAAKKATATRSTSTTIVHDDAETYPAGVRQIDYIDPKRYLVILDDDTTFILDNPNDIPQVLSDLGK